MPETLGEILKEYKRKDKRKDVVLSFRVGPEIAEMLAQAAEKTGLSKTAVLEAFIRHGHLLVFEEDMEDRSDIAAAQEAMKEAGSIPWEQVKTEMGL